MATAPKHRRGRGRRQHSDAPQVAADDGGDDRAAPGAAGAQGAAAERLERGDGGVSRSGHGRRGCKPVCLAPHGLYIHVVLRRALNGVVTVWLYFADIISDIEVAYLLYTAGVEAGRPASTLHTSPDSTLRPVHRCLRTRDALPRVHLWQEHERLPGLCVAGAAAGMLALDMLMFLEPFGLPLAGSLMMRTHSGVQGDAHHRGRTEPTAVLAAAYILVTVMHHVHDHTATGREGATQHGDRRRDLGEILPRSIAISTLTMLKTWIELVHSAREAGISVRDKIGQLWNVGHGLPLDALKKGTITTWSCQYSLSDGEVKQLYDALIKNSSLVRLNLAKAGPD